MPLQESIRGPGPREERPDEDEGHVSGCLCVGPEVRAPGPVNAPRVRDEPPDRQYDPPDDGNAVKAPHPRRAARRVELLLGARADDEHGCTLGAQREELGCGGLWEHVWVLLPLAHERHAARQEPEPRGHGVKGALLGRKDQRVVLVAPPDEQYVAHRGS
ncbi:hypothetical protein M885DRAFT_508128 [Pelagophyceae sp. CCMP2097]|nr:hypothetical protein M885DRAFT_508128 [Pelagophyceae sp. CCMP2097]